ncbi:MAG: L,D-transpeptidase family protein [Gemmatimonadota bacterium]
MIGYATARTALPPLVLLMAAACGGGDTDSPPADTRAPEAEVPAASERTGSDPATALASGSEELSPDEIEAGRMDSSWKAYVEVDPAARSAGTASPEQRPAGAGSPESGSPDTAAAAAAETGETSNPGWEEIRKETVNSQPRSLPIHGDVEGPAVARVQILLDLNRFSPGVIDGRWGKNTEKAVYWFQKANDLGATGEVDRATLDALERGAGRELVVTRRITEADISGPFEDLPEDVYARAEQPCLCYESQREQLGEVFHAAPELLEQLNPDVDLNTVSAGDPLDVPAVEPFHIDELPEGKYTGGDRVDRIVISDGGNYLHALDDAGQILFHSPSTLGADYAPSPEGDFSVESITFDPTWHYQPELLSGVDPSKEDAVLPEGPNNAVGVVWMQLSKPHYGIHGTKAPETIGYATSHGCVRLTNWDAAFLGQRIPPGVPVEFRDVTGRD